MVNIIEVFLWLGNVMSHAFSLPGTLGGRCEELGCLSSQRPSAVQAQGTPFTLKSGLQSVSHTMNGSPGKTELPGSVTATVLIKCLVLVCFFLLCFFPQKQRAGERQKGVGMMNPLGLKQWFVTED